MLQSLSSGEMTPERATTRAALKRAGQSSFPLWLWFLNFKLQVQFVFVVYESVNLWGFVFTDEVPWDTTIPTIIRKYSLVEVEGPVFEAYALVVMGMFAVLYIFLVVDAVLVPPIAEQAFAKEFKQLLQSLTSFSQLRKVLKLRTLKALAYQVCALTLRP
jgi:hypothetical protein